MIIYKKSWLQSEPKQVEEHLNTGANPSWLQVSNLRSVLLSCQSRVFNISSFCPSTLFTELRILLEHFIMKPACPAFFRRMCLSSIAFISRLAPTGVWLHYVKVLFSLYFGFFFPQFRMWLKTLMGTDNAINWRNCFLNVNVTVWAPTPLCIRVQLKSSQ